MNGFKHERQKEKGYGKGYGIQFQNGFIFSGSVGFELAGYLTGVKVLWASEIEPFPIMVTQTRFPGCKHFRRKLSMFT